MSKDQIFHQIIRTISQPTLTLSANRHNPDNWKADFLKSIDQYNDWFYACAPQVYRDARIRATEYVERDLLATRDLKQITVKALEKDPKMLNTLRMATCPPLARDRLAGLAGADRDLIKIMEEEHRLKKIEQGRLDAQLAGIIKVVKRLLDVDIMPWLERRDSPTEQERYRAANVIAERMCGASADPIIKNEQEARQKRLIRGHLISKGYTELLTHQVKVLEMPARTFVFGKNLVGIRADGKPVNIPIDATIQPRKAKAGDIPIFVECKSAGDEINPNKRRKEESDKLHNLERALKVRPNFVLFLCGYFSPGYLGYEAAEGIDWVWEHRIKDFAALGI